MTTPYDRYTARSKQLYFIQSLNILHQSLDDNGVCHLCCVIPSLPLVLFSKRENIPLVAISLVCNQSPSLITKRYYGKELSFEGILKNSQQKAYFNLMNLSPYQLKIDVSSNSSNFEDECTENRLLPFQTTIVSVHQKDRLPIKASTSKDQSNRILYKNFTISIRPRSTEEDLISILSDGVYWDCKEVIVFREKSNQSVFDSEFGHAYAIKSGQIKDITDKTGWTFSNDVPTSRNGGLVSLSVYIEPTLNILPKEFFPKKELLHEVEQAIEQSIRGIVPLEEKKQVEKCLGCSSNSPFIIFYSCGHKCLCAECAKECIKTKSTKCPLCKKLAVAIYPSVELEEQSPPPGGYCVLI